jgi:mono/diheme cytochrome c family protein
MIPRPPVIALALLVLPAVARAAPTPPDFDRDVKPILQKHCFQCHGPEKQKGGLRLDQKPSALRGGDSGTPAIVPGNQVKSHLLKLVSSNDPDEMMPPKGERLKPEEVALLAKWIETGAHWTDPTAAAQVLEATPDRQITAEDRKFWSFVRPTRQQPPPVKQPQWIRTPVDQFILAKHEERGIVHAGEATREVLIRRLAYDLTGLPPTPEEVHAFVADQRPDAYEQLVNRLFASPRFGERLASMWLPLARYAEDQAHQVGKDTKFFYPNAYKYRQWVVEAFNRDLPYDQFITLQLAADYVLRATNTPGQSAGSAGDHSAAPDLAALGFLGLGPKYYGRGNITVMADEWEDRVDTVTRTTLALTVACARCHDHKFDPVSTRDYYALAGVFASTKMVNKSADGKLEKPDATADKMSPDTLHVVEDDPQPKDLNVFIRGNPERKGAVVPRRFLTVLSPSEPTPFKQGSGRLELAQAIASRSNPLTARVMVNRVWGLITGKPIVPTPSNFGHSGQPPTNQPLLDDLAVRFMDNGWSIKWLVREIVLSSTYRQSSELNPIGAGADPSNELHWRANRRRMSVEQWRDTLLYVSNTLQTGGGKSLELTDPKNFRRTLYSRVSRLQLNEILLQFDYPDANVHAESRSATNTPTQKLFVLNHPFMIGQAKALAARLAAENPLGDRSRITRAYQLLFSRNPDPQEIELALAFLSQPTDSDLSRWEQYAQVLLASNELLYVD